MARAGLKETRRALQTLRGEPLPTAELETLAVIATGLSNTEIAAALVVTEATVKTHVNHLLAMRGRSTAAGTARGRIRRPDQTGL